MKYFYVSILIFSFACSSPMKNEVKSYCTCLEDVYGKKKALQKLQRCFDIHDSLKTKYIEDQKYWRELNSKMKDCADQWVQ